ncbi:hypothetical protein RclHR1_08210005 [Rhizophagus clarus]|uniref:HMG box domain-containing protein n=1 Tax=Rhizophagus clarus TaxID=94130 RepID=A0A2Z6SEI9_9GLOM|nr:hypothetical protein RclHR1_08210005 [Rhizophagus clarus]GES85006.1 hypothetical protein GLOIN_2v1769227 [Rhizophagus clarus]
MSQEGNIISTELTNNQYENICKNIKSFPIKLSYNDLYPRKHLRNGRYKNRNWKVPSAYFIFRRELSFTFVRNNIYKMKNFSKFAAQKWMELPDEIRQKYKNFCVDALEYHDYKISSPTYQLIKF